MSRCKAAMDAWLRAISSVTMAGSVSIGAGAPPAGAAGRGPSSGSDRMKSSRSTMVCSASPISGSDLPRTSRRPARLAGEARRLGDVDEQPPAGLVHRPQGRQLPQREPEGLHGVGHHLLMTDGDVDVVLLVAGRGDGEQRGDRPALHDLEAVVDQAPLDVLRAAEVRFDPPAQLRESHDLRIGQRRLLLPRWVDRLFLRPAGRQGVDGELLGGDRLGDDLAVAHLCRRPRSPGLRPGPRRGRSWPRRRRPSGWT